MHPNDMLIIVGFVLAMLGIVAFGAKMLHAEITHNRKMAKLKASQRKNDPATK